MAQWKKQALGHLKDSFSSRHSKAKKHDEALKDELYGQIGRLKVELDWLKKDPDCSADGPISARAKGQMVDPEHPRLSIQRQCELLALARSSYYYQTKRTPTTFF